MPPISQGRGYFNYMPTGVYKRTKSVWNKGLTKKDDKRIVYNRPTCFKKGQIAWNKGIKGFGKEFGFQKGHGYIGGGSAKGKRNSIITEFKKGIIPWNKGIHGVMKAWNKGLGKQTTTERQKEMVTWQYLEWRKKVFQKDDWTCQKCKKRGGKLIADHIKMWCLFPELRYDLNNGQTLCKECSIEKTRKELRVFWKNQYRVSLNLI